MVSKSVSPRVCEMEVFIYNREIDIRVGADSDAVRD
jgi:hypothetical protein